MSRIYDMIIIGSGPAGLAAAVYGQRAKLDLLVIEKQMIRKEDVLDFVRSRDFDVLVVLGAGNLDNYVPRITEILNGK